MEDEETAAALRKAMEEVEDLQRKLQAAMEQNKTGRDSCALWESQSPRPRKVQRSAPYSYSAGHRPTDVIQLLPKAQPECTMVIVHPDVLVATEA